MRPLTSDPAAPADVQVVLDDGTSTRIVVDYVVARELLVSARFSRAIASEQLGTHGPALDLSVTEMDPPRHAWIRALLSRSYSARSVERLRPRIEQIAGALSTELLAAGPPIDLVAAFCAPFTFACQCELLGVPQAPRERLRRWSVARSGQPGASAESAAAAEVRLHRDVGEVLRELRQAPGSGLFSRLIDACDRDGLIDEHELHGIASSMFFDGHFLAATQIANSVLYLFDHPHLHVRLLADPTLLGAAIEELLRVCPAVNHSMPRVAVEDCELGGVPIPAGATLTASLPTANRDACAFGAGADDIDLDRGSPPHLSFGRGIHYCLGAHLARIEVHVALGALLSSLPDMRLAVARETLRPFRTQGAVGVLELPVAW